MTREMPTYSRSTDSLPDFVVENQLNTFVYLKFLICPPCCHDDAKLEKIRHITKLHLIKRLLQVTKLDILIHSAFHQWRFVKFMLQLHFFKPFFFLLKIIIAQTFFFECLVEFIKYFI